MDTPKREPDTLAADASPAPPKRVRSQPVLSETDQLKKDYAQAIGANLKKLRPKVLSALQKFLATSKARTARDIFFEIQPGSYDTGLPIKIRLDEGEVQALTREEDVIIPSRSTHADLLDRVAKNDAVGVIEYAVEVLCEWFGKCWDTVGADLKIAKYASAAIGLHEDNRFYNLRGRHWQDANENEEDDLSDEAGVDDAADADADSGDDVGDDDDVPDEDE